MSKLLLADCGGPFDLTAAHTISSWESKPTTGAEAAVIAFLESDPRRYAGKRLLHAGVGNGSLAGALARNLAEYIGLTISLPETRAFAKRFAAMTEAKVVLANKHDPRTYSSIVGHFDLIIDVNLKSFACCEKHFEAMMAFYVDRLAPKGALITGETGLLFGWQGNTNVAYTPGAQLDSSAAESRVLGIEGLKGLSGRYGLALSAIPDSAFRATSAATETLWIMEKA